VRHASPIAIGFAVLLFASSVHAQASASRERLRFIEGSYRVTSGAPGDTTNATWRFRPILGGKYLELQEVLTVEFRATIGFDSTSQRFRLSLLDAGSGAFDVYEGDFDAQGTLVLQNPHFWRVTFAPTARGLLWRFERSVDGGTTWRGRPATEMIRIVAP
jgi:hypothetical protein